MADQLGSTRLVTDQSGSVVARHDFLPFGEEIPANTAGRPVPFGPEGDSINQKFTGQMRDPETGLDYFNARYFAAAPGRFNSPDPANAGADLTNPQSWNAYAYVNNNPLAFVDPLGLDPQPVPGQPGCTWDPDTNTLYCGGTGVHGCVAEGTEGCIPPPVTIGGGPPNSNPPGSGGGSGAPSIQRPPRNGSCVVPSAVQQKMLPIQAAAAKFWGKTLLAGLGASGGAGLGKGIGVYGSASAQIAVSPNGNAAYAITFAAPASVTGAGTYAWVTPSTKGIGLLGGSQFGVSNVSDPSQLAGPSLDGSASIAAGLGIGADLSVGDGSWQFNVTLGFGLGGRGSAGARTYTAVVPICGSW